MFWYKYKTTTIIFISLVFIFSAYFCATFAVFLYTPASFSDQGVVVDIPNGYSFRAVTKLLYDNGLVKDERKFLILARLRHAGSKIHAGELLFKKNMTPIQVLDDLLYGKPVTYSFVVPEGYNMYQIAGVLQSKAIIKKASDFVAAAKSKPLLIELGIRSNSAEGYLFPDTYSVQKVRDVKDLVRVMFKRYREIFTKNMADRAKELGFSENEMLTLASIIEKETGAPQERKMVSSVFHNRLKKGMMLQSDPTTIYGIWTRYDGNLTKDDLMQYTPYNTYKMYGLPAGPIANPGKDSIVAALYPERTNYLYFVSKNDGTHIFSENYKGHQNAVTKFQKHTDQRVGKSWRDLKNKNKNR